MSYVYVEPFYPEEADGDIKIVLAPGWQDAIEIYSTKVSYDVLHQEASEEEVHEGDSSAEAGPRSGSSSERGHDSESRSDSVSHSESNSETELNAK